MTDNNRRYTMTFFHLGRKRRRSVTRVLPALSAYANSTGRFIGWKFCELTLQAPRLRRQCPFTRINQRFRRNVLYSFERSTFNHCRSASEGWRDQPAQNIAVADSGGHLAARVWINGRRSAGSISDQEGVHGGAFDISTRELAKPPGRSGLCRTRAFNQGRVMIFAGNVSLYREGYAGTSIERLGRAQLFAH